MPTFTRTSSITGTEVSTSTTDSQTGAEAATVTVTLPAGKPGTLTTRTDADTGVITSVGHGLTAADFVSVFWTDATTGAEMYRVNMDVTAVTADTLSVDLGLGDALPPVNAAVIIGQVVSRPVAWDGVAAGMLGLIVGSGARASFTAQAVGTVLGLTATDLSRQLKTNSRGYCWLNGDVAFPFTGPLLLLTGANGSTSGGQLMTFSRLDA